MVAYNIAVFLIVFLMFVVVAIVGLIIWYTRRRARDVAGLGKSMSDLGVIA